VAGPPRGGACRCRCARRTGVHRGARRRTPPRRIASRSAC
jgi:hypothetical protein